METQYHIRVRGHLPESWFEMLERMELICDVDGNTTLSGPIRDQADLYGMITKLQNLGLTLISINQITPAGSNEQ